MMRTLLATFSSLLLTGLTTHAELITTIWEVTVTNQRDYAAGQNVPITVPTNFDLPISFPSSVSTSTDFGTTTITRFGNFGDTSMPSPLSSFVGADPFGGGIDPTRLYTFPNVSDYPSVFIEEFAAQGNSHSSSGSMFWTHRIELRATRRSPARSGVGLDDYAFSTPSLLSFLNDINTSPADFSINFSEYWYIYDSDTSSYVDGMGWSGSATLASVAVPEPSLTVFLGIGILLFLLGFRRRRSFNQSDVVRV